MLFNNIILGTSILSVLSSLVILTFYLTIKQIRIPSYRIILYLTLGNLLQAVSRILIIIYIQFQVPVLCEVALTSVGIGDIEAMVWTLFYSIQTNLVLVSAASGRTPKFLFASKNVEIAILAVGAFAPTIIITGMYLLQLHMSRIEPCDRKFTDMVYNEVDIMEVGINLFYCALFLVIFLTNLMILRKIVFIQTLKFKANITILKRRMVIFNLVFFCCNVGYVISVIYSIAEHQIPIVLQYISNFSLSVWGLANAATVAFTPLLVREIKIRFGISVDYDNGDVILTTIPTPQTSTHSFQVGDHYQRDFKLTEVLKGGTASKEGVQISDRNSTNTLKSESSWLSEI